MYRRAELSRTVMLVVALLLTAVSTGVFAREFRASDTMNGMFLSRQPGEEQATRERTRAGAIDLNPVNVAWIGTLRDGATAQPIERIREVE